MHSHQNCPSQTCLSQHIPWSVSFKHFPSVHVCTFSMLFPLATKIYYYDCETWSLVAIVEKCPWVLGTTQVDAIPVTVLSCTPLQSPYFSTLTGFRDGGGDSRRILDGTNGIDASKNVFFLISCSPNRQTVCASIFGVVPFPKHVVRIFCVVSWRSTYCICVKKLPHMGWLIIALSTSDVLRSRSRFTNM